MKMTITAQIAQAVRDAYSSAPLAGSWTNFVTVNLVANAQLAVGGRAAMCYLPDEAVPLSTISRATYINAGTLTPAAIEAFPLAAKTTLEQGKPWVLDPVAVGLGDTRNAILAGLKAYPPTIVRANASEVIGLAALWQLHTQAAGGADGVDSTDSVEAALPAARKLAEFSSGAVAISGEVDIVTDGASAYRLTGGSAYLTRITGAGCSLGGVVAVYAAVSQPLIAALTGSVVYNWASDQAAQDYHGTFSFQTAFIDKLSELDAAVIESYAAERIQEI
jgi:hydroxyethylthiazole kinase